MTLLIVALACAAAGYLLGLLKSQSESRSLLERAARAEAEAQGAKDALGADQQRLDKLKSEFGELAGRLLEDRSNKLREDATLQFGHLMAPLKQGLDDFKRMHSEDSLSRNTLTEQIRSLKDAHSVLSSKTDDLSLSLKGNVKAQGKWGEVMLSRVLELSGLEAGRNYRLQAEGLELKDEAGNPQRPDAVVLLPDGKQLIVDAKAPLEGYFLTLEAKTDAERKAGLEALVKALRTQITGLSAKKYYANAKLSTPEFTLMFIPIEGALSLALQQEPKLFEDAWEKRILLVGPNMLFGTLKVTGQIWSQEKRNRNAEEIATRGGLLYEKLIGFVADFSKAKESLLEAQKKLVDGPGNLISQAQKLKELGARTDKKLPSAWLEAAGEDEAAPANLA
jgi:DNA recombination protein RmuC